MYFLYSESVVFLSLSYWYIFLERKRNKWNVHTDPFWYRWTQIVNNFCREILARICCIHLYAVFLVVYLKFITLLSPNLAFCRNYLTLQKQNIIMFVLLMFSYNYWLPYEDLIINKFIVINYVVNEREQNISIHPL